MKLFHPGNSRPLKLTLRQDRVRDIKRGYPWVFPHSLVELPKSAPGTFALLRDKDGTIIAKGMYDPSCPVAFRVCELQHELSDASISRALERAVALRSAVASAETTAFRLINGEGDGLPGLICDLFDDTAVFQLDGLGPAAFWNLDGVAHLVQQLTGAKRGYLKPRSGSEEKPRVLFGSLPSEQARFLEHGMHFESNLIHGAKSGFFLDQRENRRIIRTLSSGKRVLNLFGYTGGFSVAAGLGGATTVTTVDIARPAIEGAAINWTLNGLPESMHHGVTRNAFEYLEEMKGLTERFDIIIADPPSFVPSKMAVEKGRGAYVSIFSSAIGLLEAGGILAASSCSSHISSELFMDICQDSVSRARRKATVLGVYGQPVDHPFPLACDELRYLKFVLLRIE